jgi:hypothetical protein
LIRVQIRGIGAIVHDFYTGVEQMFANTAAFPPAAGVRRARRAAALSR